MNVSVGYFCDPEGLPGLAHFLGELPVLTCCIKREKLVIVDV
jgi:hypothetical protein